MDFILQFVNEKKATDHISPNRVNKIVSTLVNWRRFLSVESNRAKITDIYEAIDKMKTGNSQKGKLLEANTQHDYVRILKMFVNWMIENRITRLPQDKIKKISAPGQNHDTTEPHEILTKEEIERLLLGCRSTRDRALISVLYESGVRVGELSRLRWKDVVFDKKGVKLYIDDRKTGKKRYSRLTMSVEYLAQLRADYTGPRGKDGSPIIAAPIFISREGQTLTHIAVLRILQRTMENAGITRKITPHLFRKSRITHMVADNFQESVIKQSVWNNLATGMFQTCVKLSEKDIDAEFLSKAGYKEKETKEPRGLKPRMCGECHTSNPPVAEYCLKCGQPITDKAREDLKEAEEEIRADPRYQEMLRILKKDLGIVS